MNCRQAFEKLYEYLDLELTRETEKEFEGHLEHCSDCLKRYDLEKSFQDALAAKLHTQHDITALKKKIKGEITKIDSNPGSKNIFFLIGPLVAAAVIAFIAFIPRSVLIHDVEAVTRVVASLAGKHQDCLKKLVNWEVKSSDPRVIDSCMSLFIDLPRRLFEFDSSQIRIVAAALNHLNAGDETQFEFEIQDEKVSMFVSRISKIDKAPFRKIKNKGQEMYVSSCRHYNYVIWSCDGWECVAVSSIAEENLLQFAAAF